MPVLVEAERLRPGLEGLLALADFVVTSAHFPQAGRTRLLASSWSPHIPAQDDLQARQHIASSAAERRA